MKPPYQYDVDLLVNALHEIPTDWDGKKAILKLKEIDYQWRQKEYKFSCLKLPE